MKLKPKEKKINTLLSVLLGRRKESRGRLTDCAGLSDTATFVSSNSVVQDTEGRHNAAGVKNVRSNDLNDDTPSTIGALRSDTPHVSASKYEAPDVNANDSSGFFSNAHHLIFMNPTMVEEHTNIFHVVGDKEGKAKELLSQHVILGAAHDSSARDPPPQCHPGTRIKINERIMSWFYDETKRELILWIYGPAGVGKSAIVQTIADALALANCLGASVFISRPNGRNSSHSVFITVAYQLAVHIEAYCAFISSKLASDPELVNKSMKEQFRTFIIEPFVEKKIGAGRKTWGILLDGLDELNESLWQREIIHLITAFALEHPDVPLAWVIASRPEPHIVDTFKAPQIVSSFWEEHVPIDSPEACQDVEPYLRSSFETMRQDSPRIIPRDWPSEINIVNLAHVASGLFAFASVAIRFIEDPKHSDPVTRLDAVLSVIDGSVVSSADDQPFAHLDALYMRILTAVPSKMWPLTQLVLGSILWLPGNLGCVKGLSVILDHGPSKIYSSINDLYSVLNVSLDDVYSQSLYFHHASFVDFLWKANRSKEFYISFEDILRDLDNCGLRIWRDFKKKYPRGPSSEYQKRWSEYASQFHSDVNLPADVLGRFNYSLYDYIHRALLNSMQGSHDMVQKAASQSPDLWDRFFGLLSQVDAATACQWPKECPTHVGMKSASSMQMGHEGHKQTLLSCESLNEYVSGIEHFKQCYPQHPVLLCGTPGNRFAVFIYEYNEDDFKERSLHTGGLGSAKADGYNYHRYYCIPYPDVSFNGDQLLCVSTHGT